MFLIILGVLFVLFVIECLLLEVEHWGWATVTLILSGIAVQLLGIANIWGFVTHHTVDALLYVLGYLAVGVVWSFIKWFSFLMGFRDRYREVKTEFFASHGVPLDQALNKEQAEAFHHTLWRQSWNGYRGVNLSKRPSATNNKRRITAWMSFWPFSMAGTIINDPIRRLFKFLFNQLKASYQRIADHVFRNDPDLT